MVRRPNARWPCFLDVVLVSAFAAPLAAHAATIPGVDPPAAGQRESLTLYLEVVLNHSRLPGLHVFELRQGRLHAGADTLRAIGFRTPGAADAGPVPLGTLPGVVARYDAARQRAEIDAPLSSLALDTTLLDSRVGAPAVAAAASPGLLLNYDLYATDGSHGQSMTASSEVRVFGVGRGVFSNTAVTRGVRAAGGGWRGDSVRLDTHWQLSFPERAVTATFGDAFTGFLDWTRPVRIGGIQVGRNYALQPYRITAPMPEFLGEAVVPSDVELFINGMRQYSGRAPVGPFQLSTVPGLTGAGHAHLVVTDAFGQVRTLDFPFYSTQRLLARGLSDWSVSLGVVRRDYGLRSFSYGGGPVASGSWRHGISDRFTMEVHAEASDELRNVGLGGAWLLGMAGLVHASHARSSHLGATGWQRSLGYVWNNQRYNLSLDTRRAHGDYRDVATLHGAPPARRSERAMAGVNGALGNLSLSYTRLDHPDDEIGRLRYAGLYWNRSFNGAWSASVSANQNLDLDEDRSLYVGISIPLGRDHQASASWQRDRGRDQFVADVVRPVPGDGGLGWRVQARTGDDASGGLAELDWQGEAIRLGLGASHYDGEQHAYTRAGGSLVVMGGAAFATRHVHDAFALVSTDGHPGIPVRLENRPIGHTDHRGLLLVPRLNAWQRNRLSIDPLDLPADIRVGTVDVLATPPDRAGTRVEFELRPVRAALLVLHDAGGQPLPLGSRVRVEGAADDTVVGHDGETYVELLGTQERVDGALADGSCVFAFDYPASGSGIPRIGPLRCMEETR